MDAKLNGFTVCNQNSLSYFDVRTMSNTDIVLTLSVYNKPLSNPNSTSYFDVRTTSASDGPLIIGYILQC